MVAGNRVHANFADDGRRRTDEGQNCLIAEHGLNDMSGRYDYFGQVYVYFNYGADGQINILDMTFEESRLYYLEQKESGSANE